MVIAKVDEEESLYSGLYLNVYNSKPLELIKLLKNDEKNLLVMGNKNKGRSIISIFDQKTNKIIEDIFDDGKSNYFILNFHSPYLIVLESFKLVSKYYIYDYLKEEKFFLFENTTNQYSNKVKEFLDIF